MNRAARIELESAGANGPGACGQYSLELLANRRLDLLVTRGEIARRRALPRQEWLPIIVKAGEARYNVERMQGWVFQLRLFEEAAQALLGAHGETVPGRG